jgi:hypothetical protein
MVIKHVGKNQFVFLFQPQSYEKLRAEQNKFTYFSSATEFFLLNEKPKSGKV